MFDPYGKVTVLDGNGTPRTVNESLYGNPWTFCGYRNDQETGLLHTHNRYLSPELGRFLERNPWAYIQSRWSLYDFVMGSPAVFLEPFSWAGRKGEESWEEYVKRHPSEVNGPDGKMKRQRVTEHGGGNQGPDGRGIHYDDEHGNKIFPHSEEIENKSTKKTVPMSNKYRKAFRTAGILSIALAILLDATAAAEDVYGEEGSECRELWNAVKERDVERIFRSTGGEGDMITKCRNELLCKGFKGAYLFETEIRNKLQKVLSEKQSQSGESE
jgi:RHS repeat-associated protein